MTGAPPTKRLAMTPARRRAALARYGGVCAHVGCETAHGLEIDHIVPLELTGTEEIENLQPLCEPHHKIKTKKDAADIARARRRRRKADGDIKPKAQIKSRGFPPGKRPFPKGRGFQSRKVNR